MAGVGLGLAVLEAAVGESDVWVTEATVGVPEGGGDVGVFVPLQAATDNTSKSINRLIYELLFFYIGRIGVYDIPRIIFQITAKILHMFLHNIRRAKLDKECRTDP